MEDRKWVLAVDLGGTKIEIALVNPKGELRNKVKIPTKVEEGYQAILSDLIHHIRNVQKEEKNSLVGAALGVAGQIQKHTGRVEFAPNLTWRKVPLQHELSQALHLPVFVTNDVRAATWGESLYGAGRGIKDLICIFFGTGIGAGIIANGILLQGAENTAGEIGHMMIDIKGEPCTCGNRGCFETISAGWAIAKKAREAIEEDSDNGKEILKFAKNEIENIRAKEVIRAFHEGDPVAKQIVQDAVEGAIAGVTSLVNILNPQKIIIGGGIVQSLPDLVRWISEGVSKRALKSASEKLEVVVCELQNEAGLKGAASLFFNTHEF